MRPTIPLGRIRGIEVGANWSTFLIVALISVNVTIGILPAVHPEAPILYLAVAGLIGAVLFLASILAHEVAHGLVAQRNGIQVKSISLWVLGGVAQLEGEPKSPGADFRIAAVGPLTSFVLGAGFGLLALAGSIIVGVAVPVTVLAYLGIVNVILAVFNLIPATPLDGGRVLRAAVWKFGKSRSRAVAVASGAGMVFGGVLLALGAYQLLVQGSFGGLWYGVLGFFIYTAAKNEGAYTATQEKLSGKTVRDVLPAGMAVIPTPLMPAGAVLHQILPLTHANALPVLSGTGTPIGVVRRARLQQLPAESHDMPIGELLEPAGSTTLDTDVLKAAETFERSGATLVFDGDTLRGVLTVEDLNRVLTQH